MKTKTIGPCQEGKLHVGVTFKHCDKVVLLVIICIRRRSAFECQISDILDSL